MNEKIAIEKNFEHLLYYFIITLNYILSKLSSDDSKNYYIP